METDPEVLLEFPDYGEAIQKHGDKAAEIDALKAKSLTDLWSTDLDALDAVLDDMEEEDAAEVAEEEKLKAMKVSSSSSTE